MGIYVTLRRRLDLKIWQRFSLYINNDDDNNKNNDDKNNNLIFGR